MLALLKRLNVEVETGPTPSDNALIIVTPLGQDATTCAMSDGLDPARVIAVDTLLGLDSGLRRLIMPPTATRPNILARMQALFAIDAPRDHHPRFWRLRRAAHSRLCLQRGL